MGEIIKVCLHQAFRPTIYIKPEIGYGDCTKCTPDEKNKECKGYYPITIQTFEVKNELSGMPNVILGQS